MADPSRMVKPFFGGGRIHGDSAGQPGRRAERKWKSPAFLRAGRFLLPSNGENKQYNQHITTTDGACHGFSDSPLTARRPDRSAPNREGGANRRRLSAECSGNREPES